MEWIRKVLKYYNIFTYLYLRYFRGKKQISLEAVQEFTLDLAYKKSESMSWWDVFDGIMWMCSVIFGMILWGFLF